MNSPSGFSAWRALMQGADQIVGPVQGERRKDKVKTPSANGRRSWLGDEMRRSGEERVAETSTAALDQGAFQAWTSRARNSDGRGEAQARAAQIASATRRTSQFDRPVGEVPAARRCRKSARSKRARERANRAGASLAVEERGGVFTRDRPCYLAPTRSPARRRTGREGGHGLRSAPCGELCGGRPPAGRSICALPPRALDDRAVVRRRESRPAAWAGSPSSRRRVCDALRRASAPTTWPWRRCAACAGPNSGRWPRCAPPASTTSTRAI